MSPSRLISPTPTPTDSRSTPRRRSRLLAGVCAVALGLGLLAPPADAGTASATSGRSTAVAAPLTNLAHLNFLGDRVAVRSTPAHTTYRLAQDPTVGVLWVYAESAPDGSFARVGGGQLNPATGHYGQGAYDADDIARAAVVYLRQWKATGDTGSRDRAYQLLRGLTYLQTLTGPHRGEVVLWMQSDGTLNPSPTPADNPTPSDSGASYWLARSLWAYGEGYADFAHSDPAFAAFLRARMDLAITALNRDVLVRYRTYHLIHGIKVPAWLIVDGADASAEAVLGLAAYVRAGGGAVARTALGQLATGISRMSSGTTTSWPFRALLPWALSRSDWHAWGSTMSTALAAASGALHNQGLLHPAVADTAGFTAQLLTSTGPLNGLLPGPSDGVTIAYGADSRVQGLYAVGTAAGSPGIRRLAGVTAGWFFGQNVSGGPTYDPATGVTRDAVEADGRINPNSGAESTIHGLLTMQLLDAHPELAVLARASSTIDRRDGLAVVEAETGVLSQDATVRTPVPQWTGESLWSGQQLMLHAGGSTSWTLPAADGPRLIAPVVELTRFSPALLSFAANGSTIGLVHPSAVGAQGDSPSPTMLLPVTLRGTIGAGVTTLRAHAAYFSTALDQLLVMPEVATLATHGNGHAVTLLTSKAAGVRTRTVTVGGRGSLTWAAYDRNGAPVSKGTGAGATAQVQVAPGGFTLVSR